jgi:hypothetical protein
MSALSDYVKTGLRLSKLSWFKGLNSKLLEDKEKLEQPA